MTSEITERNETESMYERLMLSYDKSKNENTTIIDDIDGSRMFEETFYWNDQIYKEQIEQIKRNIPEKIKPDTVGEYLYGCIQDDIGENSVCKPSCVNGGLKNPAIGDCMVPSYYKREQMEKLNEIKGEEANVFIETCRSKIKTDLLSTEDIKILSDDGVKRAVIYTQHEDTINYILWGSIEVKNNNEITNDTNWLWIIVAIILVVALSVVLLNQS